MRQSAESGAAANEYTVRRLDEDTFELWLNERLLATMTREEAWPVMIGRVHPDEFVQEQRGEAGQDRGD